MPIDEPVKNGISALIRTVYERACLPSLFFAFEDTLKFTVCSPEEGSHQNLTKLAPRYGTSNLQNCEK